MAEPCLDNRKTPASPGACVPQGAAHGGAKHGARQALRMTEGYGAQAALLAPRPHQAGAGPFGSTRVPAGKGGTCRVGHQPTMPPQAWEVERGGDLRPEPQHEVGGGEVLVDERCYPPTEEELIALKLGSERAVAALLRLGTEAVRAIDAQRVAQQLAWRWFIARTGGTPDLALDDNAYAAHVGLLSGVQAAPHPLAPLAEPVAGAAKEGFGKLAGVGAKAAGEALGGTLGKALLSGLGGFIVGKVAGLVWDAVALIIGMKHQDDAEAIDRALKNTETHDKAAYLAIEARADASKSDWSQTQVRLHRAITLCRDAAELEALTATIEASHSELPVAPDAAKLGVWLLERWTLQHAGDARNANERTNPASWESAADLLDARKNDAPLKDGRWQRDEDGCIATPDLFADQCRLELSLFGLDPEPLIAEIRRSPRDRHEVACRYRTARDAKLWKDSAETASPGAWRFRIGDDIDEVHVMVSAHMRGASHRGRAPTLSVSAFEFQVLGRREQRLAGWQRSTR